MSLGLMAEVRKEIARNPAAAQVCALLDVGANAQGDLDAVRLMMRLRLQLLYRGRGFLLLNAACHRLGARYQVAKGAS